MTSDQTETPSPPSPTVNRNPALRAATEAFRNGAFLVCLVLMLTLAGGYQAMVSASGTKLTKKPVPLRRPLKLLDTTRLTPYELRHAGDIKAEILDALGTREYIEWTLEDTSIGKNLPERLIHLFVTYYTGTPGQVPHVAEECYKGGGYRALGEDLVEVPIPELQQTISVKVVTFEPPVFQRRESAVVMYVFHTNGRFAPDRRVVRTILNNPRDEHAYFTKVEISFGTSEACPPRDQAIEAGKRFLQKVIPILVREHWPDWAAVKQQEEAEKQE
ncbi:MAG: hypothetical protein HY718_21750 [Planctomycetes bacterium]|nr:hypothetical protein [Planctomycetota bacterium]